MTWALGIDVGGTKIAAGLVGPGGAVTSRAQAPAPAQAADLEQAALRLAREVVADVRIEAIGVGCPGTIDPYTGEVVASDSKPGLVGANVGKAVAAQFDVPYAVTNDANAAGVGELAYGAAAGFSRVIVVAVGTGVGGALLINGRVEEGPRGTAGEIAHLLVPGNGLEMCGCGRRNHLEAVASGPAIAAAYNAGTSSLSAQEVAERAATGDVRAVEAIVAAGAILGRCIAGLANVIDVEAVVLSGGVGANERYADAAHDAFAAEVMRPLRGVPMLRGALGADAQLVGAATYVRARLGLG